MPQHNEQEQAASNDERQRDNTLPPPAEYRPDTMVRAVSPNARMELDRADSGHDEYSFTKGDQAPTFNQAGLPYTVADMDRLEQAPKGLFPDTPGGAGATRLSADRDLFIEHVMREGHFATPAEAQTWIKAVFDALRQHAIEVDDMRASELDAVVRVGEAPEVQVQEMLWGGDYAQRFAALIGRTKGWGKQDFYAAVARYGGAKADDPWVEDAIHSFFSAVKRALGPAAGAELRDLGALQPLWDNADKAA